MKSNKKKTLIHKLYIDKDISFDQKNVMPKIYTFYSKLYAQSEEEIDFVDDFFQDLPKLNSDSCAL